MDGWCRLWLRDVQSSRWAGAVPLGSVGLAPGPCLPAARAGLCAAGAGPGRLWAPARRSGPCCAPSTPCCSSADTTPRWPCSRASGTERCKRYGAKIRAPHALVMTFLFKSGSLREKLKAIAQATYTHSRNLACFVCTYKGLMALQSRLHGKNFQLHSFMAACVGGWLVFGENNHINSQINMYLLSRILFGLSRLAVEKGYIPEPKQDPFPVFAAVTWGIVLWLFEYHRQTLQPSLQSSMTYLYDDSNIWHDIADFLIYNKRSAPK